jgi:hypothetical protein
VLQAKYHQTGIRFGFSSKIKVGYQVERENLVIYTHFGKMHQNYSQNSRCHRLNFEFLAADSDSPQKMGPDDI